MPRGGFGGGFRGGYRGGFGGRRIGYPVMMGGGMGMGGGSPLLTSLLAGGVGYAIGSSNAQNTQPQYAAPPPYYYQAPPPAPTYYQAPQAVPQGSGGGTGSGSVAQLQLLADLHERGVLNDQEFAAEKQKIVSGA